KQAILVYMTLKHTKGLVLHSSDLHLHRVLYEVFMPSFAFLSQLNFALCLLLIATHLTTSQLHMWHYVKKMLNSKRNNLLGGKGKLPSIQLDAYILYIFDAILTLR
ncbi:hypothetical protein ACJX0J_024169, partial [Zea mays]